MRLSCWLSSHYWLSTFKSCCRAIRSPHCSFQAASTCQSRPRSDLFQRWSLELVAVRTIKLSSSCPDLAARPLGKPVLLSPARTYLSYWMPSLRWKPWYSLKLVRQNYQQGQTLVLRQRGPMPASLLVCWCQDWNPYRGWLAQQVLAQQVLAPQALLLTPQILLPPLTPQR